jgi:hypothetical protein
LKATADNSDYADVKALFVSGELSVDQYSSEAIRTNPDYGFEDKYGKNAFATSLKALVTQARIERLEARTFPSLISCETRLFLIATN